MDSCIICEESCYKIISCPSCIYDVCSDCYKNSLEIKPNHCAGCNTKIQKSFVRKSFSTSYFKGDYKKACIKDLLRKENKKISLTISKASVGKNAANKVLNSAAKSILTKASLIAEKSVGEHNIELMKQVVDLLGQWKKDSQEIVYPIDAYVCPDKNCNGYLNQNSCINCECVVCNKCKVLIKKNHVCSQEDLDQAKSMLEIIKPCPNCKINVRKGDNDCTHIYCENCNHRFDWNTLKQIPKNIFYNRYSSRVDISYTPIPIDYVKNRSVYSRINFLKHHLHFYNNIIIVGHENLRRDFINGFIDKETLGEKLYEFDYQREYVIAMINVFNDGLNKYRDLRMSNEYMFINEINRLIDDSEFIMYGVEKELDDIQDYYNRKIPILTPSTKY